MQPVVFMQRGFSLVETMIGAALLATALVSLAHLLAMSVQIGSTARNATMATLVAEQKMEALRTLSWVAIAALDSGTDYLDAAGKTVCEGEGVPCPDAAYVRQWSAVPAPFSTAVRIVYVHAGAVGRGDGRATLVTARARMSQ